MQMTGSLMPSNASQAAGRGAGFAFGWCAPSPSSVGVSSSGGSMMAFPPAASMAPPTSTSTAHMDVDHPHTSPSPSTSLLAITDAPLTYVPSATWPVRVPTVAHTHQHQQHQHESSMAAASHSGNVDMKASHHDTPQHSTAQQGGTSWHCPYEVLQPARAPKRRADMIEVAMDADMMTDNVKELMDRPYKAQRTVEMVRALHC
ncbi:unnamed protein product [Vitrella brassicaformis CCMP3155]|uniref:Uncharacterized protein n=2 Tax=Vitrella brassicaformis TaxID=1169539 RepID=A0A0G4EUN1_VITBC|nr:unnamed protein product [Vitrella brassicaformis CCMP3155]|mmetsp:Transcript_19325/g.46689  ORF Transcript_19325/g.46689 Transcript_19325/m.46689 type:complete len:203 (+) Transcript_19325:160-768(+)|eukprot:CEM02154.1 unnamed protein product [Vitrella brassicaformis CCMP3155]